MTTRTWRPIIMTRDSQPAAHAPGRRGQVLRKLRSRLRWSAGSGLATVAAAGLLAACGSPDGAASPANSGGGQVPAAAGNAVITARQVSGVGTVLVDQAGKTIYSPEQEATRKILCTSSCLSFWFPVTVASAHVPGRASGIGGVLGTIRRPDDGKIQLTYNGKPLYTFRLDRSPGQDHGNNFRDSFGGTSFTWQAVTTTGGAARGPGPAGATPSSAYPGSGSGY
jgi:predicted lipoprotein with Yx(FWY)xxD motif